MSEKPILFSTPMVQALLAGTKTQTRRVIKPRIAPYQPGDVLWARETWLPWGSLAWDLQQWCESKGLKSEYVYRADIDQNEQATGWRPSIHMPRKAARIFLCVTDVRAERVQDISGDDCCAEGISQPYVTSESGYRFEMRAQYRELWDALYSNRGYGWDTNPWVWVYNFEKIEHGEKNDYR